MNCADRQEKLSHYLDGELTEAQRLEMEWHLSECSACAGQLDRIRALARELGRAPRPQVPADAAARLAAVIDANLRARDAAGSQPPVASIRPSWRQRLLSPAFGTAVASVAVVAVAVVVWSSNSSVTDVGPSPWSQPELAPAERNVQPTDAKPKGMLSAEDEDDGMNEAPAAGSAESPQGGRSEEKRGLRVFTENDLHKLVADVNLKAGQIPGDLKQGDAQAYYDTQSGNSEPAKLTASEVAKIIGGDREVELVYSARGLYGDGRGEAEVWIVVVAVPDRPDEAVAAAVTVEGGEILARTD